MPLADPEMNPVDVEQVYEETVRLLRYVVAVSFHVPEQDAEAIVQDAYAAYLMHASGVRDARAWLLGAVRNASRQYWRDRKRESPMPAESESWADDRDDRERLQQLDFQVARKIMDRLEPRERELLDRFYIQSESTAEIADALGSTPGSIQVLLHRCRRHAQSIYQELMRVPR